MAVRFSKVTCPHMHPPPHLTRQQAARRDVAVGLVAGQASAGAGVASGDGLCRLGDVRGRVVIHADHSICTATVAGGDLRANRAGVAVCLSPGALPPAHTPARTPARPFTCDVEILPAAADDQDARHAAGRHQGGQLADQRRDWLPIS